MGALEVVAVVPEAVDGVVMNCKVHRLSQSYDSSVVSASGLADSTRLSILDSFVLHLLISSLLVNVHSSVKHRFGAVY